MSVRVEVRLRDSISTALKHDGDAEDVEGFVFEETPRDLPRPMRAGG